MSMMNKSLLARLSSIQADPAVLDSVANEMLSIANEIDAERRRLLSTTNTITHGWQSRFTPTVISSVEVTGRRINETAEELRRMAMNLRTKASEVRRIEDAIKRAVLGIR